MNSALALVPVAVIVAGALALLLLDAVFKKAARNVLPYAALAFLVASAVGSIRSWDKGLSYFAGQLTLDKLALVLIGLLLLAASFVALISIKYVVLRRLPAAEFYTLLLLATAGAVVMVSTTSLLIIFIGLEILSISSYALTGLHFDDPKSSEAAAKYFLLGSLASAFFVLGLALIYGAGRSLGLAGLTAAIQHGGPLRAAGMLGLGLIVVALGFKIALVPFHMWTPDVYEGAATPAAAFFAVAPKAAGFAVLIRIMAALKGPGKPGQPLFIILAGLAVLTMLVGNLAALRQSNIKRLLAYSSIGHAGYISLGLLAGDPAAVVFYLAVYLFMTMGAFTVVTVMSREDAEFHELEDFAGLGFKYPWLGAAFSAFLLSLAGFPPLAGFLGKFYIFSAAVRQGFIPLAVVGVLASLVSVFFYLRVIVFLYMREPTREVDIPQENPGLFLVLFLCLYGVLQLGLNPGNVLAVIRQAVIGL